MPDINGLNLSKIIRKIYPKVKIIFITAYKDYAIDAFEVKAFDYLLKPYSESRIKNLLKTLKYDENSDISKSKCLKKLLLI